MSRAKFSFDRKVGSMLSSDISPRVVQLRMRMALPLSHLNRIVLLHTPENGYIISLVLNFPFLFEYRSM